MTDEERKELRHRRHVRAVMGNTPPHLQAHPNYSDDELELLRAMQAYQATWRVPFPSYVEVFRVILSLGYRKVPESER